IINNRNLKEHSCFIGVKTFLYTRLMSMSCIASNNEPVKDPFSKKPASKLVLPVSRSSRMVLSAIIMTFDSVFSFGQISVFCALPVELQW
ncbi:MAG: hypothetical protein ACOH2D_18200, partial [Gelidibacter sp.]